MVDRRPIVNDDELTMKVSDPRRISLLTSISQIQMG